jgi:hypothetical protein
MTGVAWDKRVGELGFVLGSFVEPTEVSENESGYKGPIAFGMGAMAVYSLEKKKFHLHAEAGAGWNFPQIVWLYTARATYLYRDVVFGGQLHYTLGVGPMLGWQMCEHVLLSANAFVNFEGHSTGQLSITVNHIGGNHH